MGVRRRDPGLACFRSGLPSVFAGCLERGFDAFSAVATAVSGAAPDSTFEVPAAAGFFLPLPPRLPRRRLFFGPAGELSSSAGSVAWGSGGASTSVTAASGTASSCCCLPKRNQRSAKCEFLSCDRARAQDGHRPDRPRAACCQDIGRHDLPTGYQSALGRLTPAAAVKRQPAEDELVARAPRADAARAAPMPRARARRIASPSDREWTRDTRTRRRLPRAAGAPRPARCSASHSCARSRRILGPGPDGAVSRG